MGQRRPDGELFIVQARPETVQARKPSTSWSAITCNNALCWYAGRVLAKEFAMALCV